MSLARDLARSLDPAMVMRDAGFEPDGWQEKAIRSDAKRKLLCCSRQSGKSETAAARALHLALYEPGALILLIFALFLGARTVSGACRVPQRSTDR